MPVSDAYLMDLQIEDLMYEIDSYVPEDEDLTLFEDEDALLEAFSLECCFGPEEWQSGHCQPPPWMGGAPCL